MLSASSPLPVPLSPSTSCTSGFSDTFYDAVDGTLDQSFQLELHAATLLAPDPSVSPAMDGIRDFSQVTVTNRLTTSTYTHHLRSKSDEFPIKRNRDKRSEREPASQTNVMNTQGMAGSGDSLHPASHFDSRSVSSKLRTAYKCAFYNANATNVTEHISRRAENHRRLTFPFSACRELSPPLSEHSNTIPISERFAIASQASDVTPCTTSPADMNSGCLEHPVPECSCVLAKNANAAFTHGKVNRPTYSRGAPVSSKGILTPQQCHDHGDHEKSLADCFQATLCDTTADVHGEINQLNIETVDLEDAETHGFCSRLGVGKNTARLGSRSDEVMRRGDVTNQPTACSSDTNGGSSGVVPFRNLDTGQVRYLSLGAIHSNENACDPVQQFLDLFNPNAENIKRLQQRFERRRSSA